MACGAASGYRNGCRCDDCRRWNRDYQREWRRRNRESGRKPVKHGRNGYSNYGCHCHVCLTAQAELQALFTTTASRNRDRAKQRRARRASVRRVQAKTLDRASRHKFQWTGPELEIVARTDLNMTQKALMLGRTKRAVAHKWLAIRRAEPTPSWLAGERARLH